LSRQILRLVNNYHVHRQRIGDAINEVMEIQQPVRFLVGIELFNKLADGGRILRSVHVSHGVNDITATRAGHAIDAPQGAAPRLRALPPLLGEIPSVAIAKHGPMRIVHHVIPPQRMELVRQRMQRREPNKFVARAAKLFTRASNRLHCGSACERKIGYALGRHPPRHSVCHNLE